ncbi:hypothetical protein BJ508DRAFT_86500 [Ascobolus immersus RN42]|uniref:Uncharacterized protein n=1 Tax=Ascobolus immersus RN42 TaxID=1160509 RepID=A0A3N4I980_ASCIM|nr:hypothetical protein BJ508DRAFT_86500 [Ascobolus immersus RN42]
MVIKQPSTCSQTQEVGSKQLSASSFSSPFPVSRPHYDIDIVLFSLQFSLITYCSVPVTSTCQTILILTMSFRRHSTTPPNNRTRPNKLRKRYPSSPPRHQQTSSPFMVPHAPLSVTLQLPETASLSLSTETTSQTTSYILRKPPGTRWYSISGLLNPLQAVCGCCLDGSGSEGMDSGSSRSARKGRRKLNAGRKSGARAGGKEEGGRYVVTFFVRRAGTVRGRPETSPATCKKGKEWWESSSAESSQTKLPAADESEPSTPGVAVTSFEFEDLDIAREVWLKEARKAQAAQAATMNFDGMKDLGDEIRRRKTERKNNALGSDVWWSDRFMETEDDDEDKLEVTISVPLGHDAFYEKRESQNGEMVELCFRRERRRGTW